MQNLDPNTMRLVDDRLDARSSAALRRTSQSIRSVLDPLPYRKKRNKDASNTPVSNAIFSIGRPYQIERLVRLVNSGSKVRPENVNEFVRHAFIRIPKKRFKQVYRKVSAATGVHATGSATKGFDEQSLRFVRSLGVGIGNEGILHDIKHWKGNESAKALGYRLRHSEIKDPNKVLSQAWGASSHNMNKYANLFVPIIKQGSVTAKASMLIRILGMEPKPMAVIDALLHDLSTSNASNKRSVMTYVLGSWLPLEFDLNDQNVAIALHLLDAGADPFQRTSPQTVFPRNDSVLAPYMGTTVLHHVLSIVGEGEPDGGLLNVILGLESPHKNKAVLAAVMVPILLRHAMAHAVPKIELLRPFFSVNYAYKYLVRVKANGLIFDYAEMVLGPPTSTQVRQQVEAWLANPRSMSRAYLNNDFNV